MDMPEERPVANEAIAEVLLRALQKDDPLVEELALLLTEHRLLLEEVASCLGLEPRASVSSIGESLEALLGASSKDREDTKEPEDEYLQDGAVLHLTGPNPYEVKVEVSLKSTLRYHYLLSTQQAGALSYYGNSPLGLQAALEAIEVFEGDPELSKYGSFSRIFPLPPSGNVFEGKHSTKELREKTPAPDSQPLFFYDTRLAILVQLWCGRAQQFYSTSFLSEDSDGRLAAAEAYEQARRQLRDYMASQTVPQDCWLLLNLREDYSPTALRLRGELKDDLLAESPREFDCLTLDLIDLVSQGILEENSSVRHPTSHCLEVERQSSNWLLELSQADKL